MRLSICLAAGVVALVLGMGAANAALVNPGFELDNASAADVPGATGWSGFNANFTTASKQHTGSQSLKVFGPFFQFGGAGVSQDQTIVPGTTYTASVFALTPTGDSVNGSNFATLALEFYDAANAQVGRQESSHVTSTSPLDTWIPLSATLAAPATATTARVVLVHVQLNNPVTGGAVYFDDADLAVVPEPTAATAGLIVLGGMALRRRRR